MNPRTPSLCLATAALAISHLVGPGAQEVVADLAGTVSFELRPVEAGTERLEPSAYERRWRAVEAGVRACQEIEPGEGRLTCLEGLERDARAAVGLRPERPEGHYWLAVALGLQVNHLGGGDKVTAASQVYREASKALEIDPGHPGAHHILGCLQLAVLRMGRITRFLATRVLGGDVLGAASWEEAEALLLFAEEHAPEVPEHHYELAVLYRDMDRPAQARREAGHVLAMTSGQGQAEIRGRAARLLERLSEGS